MLSHIEVDLSEANGMESSRIMFDAILRSRFDAAGQATVLFADFLLKQ